MKKTLRYFSLAIAALAVGGFYFSNSSENAYSPRSIEDTNQIAEGIDGAYEFLHSLKANQVSGQFSKQDIALVQEQISNQRKLSKTTFPLVWENAGPDNIGGRTRAILIDNKDNNIMYAGGVSGGVFKSVNKGASWNPVEGVMDNLNIGSICQTSNGDIYVGTGETFASQAGHELGTPGFPGDGIYKTTDGGKTFEKLPTSGIFTYVNELNVRPNTNDIYAGTNLGLYISTNEGTTWTRVLPGNCRDFAFDKNGNILAYVGPLIYHSSTPSDGNSYERSEGLSNGIRAAVTFSHSDPNYAYVVVSGSVTFEGPNGQISVGDGLVGIFQSKDNGKTFSRIVGQTSLFFSPLTHVNLGSAQGSYNLCIAVDPRDPERVFLGGIEFAEWTDDEGPKIVGNLFGHPSNPRGIHADKHEIVFDLESDPPIMYIGCDGGIYKTTNATLDNYAPMNIGYQTTQFYGISAGKNGLIAGGTQDNNSLVIDGKGSTPEAGETILGGDGFKCAVSQKNPDILFAQSQFGRLARSLNAGSSMNSIFDTRVLSQMVDGSEPGITPNNIFNTPLKLWEDENSNDNRLFHALNGEIWMDNDTVYDPNPHWYKLADVSGNPHVYEVTPDGNSLYAASFGGSRIYRVDGLNKAVFDTSVLKAADAISDSITLVDIRGNLPGGRNITDIEVDQSNPNRVIVTMGNYNNTNYVYVTENALDPAPTWRSIQGALPRFPVYDCEINLENPNEIILGTEFGIWATSNGTATTPLWTENNDGIPAVPVFEMCQVEQKKSDTWRTGPILYAGTHGNGIFRSNNLLTSTRNTATATQTLNINVYPNPAVNVLNINLNTTKKDNYAVEIYDLQGHKVLSETLNVNGNALSVDVSNMPSGTYIVQVRGAEVSGTSKIMISK